MELWVILLVLWVAWKVFGAVLEEMQNRKRQQQPGAREEDISRTPIRKVPRPGRPTQATKRMPPSPSPSSEVEPDLERLLREALSRKRQTSPRSDVPVGQSEEVAQLESESLERVRPAPAGARPPSRVETYHRAQRTRQPGPYRVEPPPPPPARDRMKPEPAFRRVTTIERRDIPPPAPATEVHRAAQVKRREKRTQGVRPSAEFLLRDLDLSQVRRGIVLSEILGPPKGLRDMEASQANYDW